MKPKEQVQKAIESLQEEIKRYEDMGYSEFINVKIHINEAKIQCLRWCLEE